MSVPVPSSRHRSRAAEVLRLRGPSALVSTVPYLVGFRPRDSLVVLALGGAGPRQRVVLTARYDLLPGVSDLLLPAVQSASREGATTLIALVYCDEEPAVALSLTGELGRVAERCELRLVEVLRVAREPDGWRWWSYMCGSPACCPTDGTPVPDADGAAAEAVGVGLVALPDRGSVEAEIAPEADAVPAVLTALEATPQRVERRDDARRRNELRWVLSLVRRRESAPAPDECARLLRALRDLQTRDALLVLDEPDQASAPRLWRTLARCAPSGWRALPLTLLAVSEMHTGGGSRLSVALEAALTDDPTYRLADLLHRCVLGAIPPQDVHADLATTSAQERGRILGGA